jgi:hypothetical protein
LEGSRPRDCLYSRLVEVRLIRRLILMPLGIVALVLGLLLFLDVLSLRMIASRLGFGPVYELVEEAHDATGHDGAQVIELALGIVGGALIVAAVRGTRPGVPDETTDTRSTRK